MLNEGISCYSRPVLHTYITERLWAFMETKSLRPERLVTTRQCKAFDLREDVQPCSTVVITLTGRYSRRLLHRGICIICHWLYALIRGLGWMLRFALYSFPIRAGDLLNAHSTEMIAIRIRLVLQPFLVPLHASMRGLRQMF